MSAFVAAAYALSPVDLIPDFIPVLGYPDDIQILPLLVSLSVSLIPKDAWKERMKDGEEKNEKLKDRWYYAVPVVIFYLFVAALAVKAIAIR